MAGIARWHETRLNANPSVPWSAARPRGPFRFNVLLHPNPRRRTLQRRATSLARSVSFPVAGRCLDHFRSLLAAAADGDLNYDHRERGTLVESDRFAALNATRELRESFERLDPICVTRPLSVTCKTSHTLAGSESATSTVAREIMYCVAHAVHHFALIGFMANVMGLSLPPQFGFAPSTIKHLAQVSQSA